MAAVRDQGNGRPLSEAAPAPRGEFTDYPGLYRAADAAAIALRRQHFLSEGVQLVLNPVSAGLVLLVATALLRLSSAVLSAVSTTLLVIVLWVVRASRWQKLWYECRSAAEDVKELTWRFMLELPPFPPGQAAVDAAFVRALDDIIRGHPEIRSELGQRAEAFTPPVTAAMQRVRASPLGERAEFYLQARVRQELSWYSFKARHYAVADRRWFAFLCLVQVAAVVSAIWLAVQIGIHPAPATAGESALPVLTAVGAAVMGWARSKRFGDLSGSYAATAHSLAGLESLRPPATDVGAYREWVATVEATLAREHETWRNMA